MPQKIFTDVKALEEELKQNKDKWLGKIITFMDYQSRVITQFRIIKITEEGIEMERLSPLPSFLL